MAPTRNHNDDSTVVWVTVGKHKAQLLEEDARHQRGLVKWISSGQHEWISLDDTSIQKEELPSKRCCRSLSVRNAPTFNEKQSNFLKHNDKKAQTSAAAKRRKLKHPPPSQAAATPPTTPRMTQRYGHNKRKKSQEDGEIKLQEQRVAKYFDGELYLGTVIESAEIPEDSDSDDGKANRCEEDDVGSKKCWLVRYDDKDKEDVDWAELQQAMKLYSKLGKKQASERQLRTPVTKKSSKDSKNYNRTAGKDGDDTTANEVTPPRKTVVTPRQTVVAPAGAARGIEKMTAEGTDVFVDAFPYKDAFVAKKFKGRPYYGQITFCELDARNTKTIPPSTNPAASQRKRTTAEVLPVWLWHVKYKDRDQEDWDLVELQQGLELYRELRGFGENKKDINKNSNETERSDDNSSTASLDSDCAEVQAIKGRRLRGTTGGAGTVEYLVQWKGAQWKNMDSWVTAEKLSPCALTEAWQNFPDSPSEHDGTAETESVATAEATVGTGVRLVDETPVITSGSGTASSDDWKTYGYRLREYVSAFIGSTRLPDSTSANEGQAAEKESGSLDVARNGTAQGKCAVEAMAVATKKGVKGCDKIANGDDENNSSSSLGEFLVDVDYDGKGMAEICINRKSYRLGHYYWTKYGCLVRISGLLSKNQSALCTHFLPSNSTFLGGPADSFVQTGKKETLPLDHLMRKFTQKKHHPRCDWIYEFQSAPPKQFASFCYYKKGGCIPPARPGKSKPAVLELFAGAGGMSLGFHNAGMETRWVVERNESAAATFKANFPGKKEPEIYTEDIRDFLAACEARKDGYPSKGEVEHLHGSPPCQGVSAANRVGGESAEENNSLIHEFTNAVRILEPPTATFENVPGILKEENRGILQRVVSELLDLNYHVRVEVLTASDYGDPQNRKRVFLWAAKSHMILPSKPEPTHGGDNLLPVRTVKDAIGGFAAEYPDITEKKTLKYPNGVLDHNFWAKGSRPLPDLHVLKAEEPARTVTGSPPVHPNGARFLTVREAACLQSFPWEYRFFGGMVEQYRQVGNAVPVMLATHVARSVARVHGLP